MTKINGIDIASFQRNINYDAVKSAGIDFAIIRAGYTGYATGKKKAKDGYFEQHYKELKARGIAVGAYWFSRATSTAEGKAEAEYMYENCLKGKQFEYPIVIDVEDGYYQKKTKAGTTAAIIGFCEFMESKGYYAMYYANPSWLRNHIDTSKLKSYDLWLAHWVANPTTAYAYNIWQYGSVKIGNLRVDGDISYLDFETLIKSKGFNGYGEQEEEKYKYKVGDKVKIIAKGNSRADGKGKVSGGVGWKRYVLAVHDGAEYPYQLGNILKITTGYYKEDAIEGV